MGWDREIAAAAAASGVDPDLVRAVMEVESRGDPTAVSPRGAIGLMQLTPATASRHGVDPYNPAENLRGGAAELARLSRRFGGDLRLTLAAYNAGEGAVGQYGEVPPYPETRDYLKRVQQILSAAKGGRRVAAPEFRPPAASITPQPYSGAPSTGSSIAEALGAQIHDDILRMIDLLLRHGAAHHIPEPPEDDEDERPRSPLGRLRQQQAEIPSGPPCAGKVSSAFGWRWHPILHVSRQHAGEDFAAATGTPVRATARGVVVRAAPRGGYGLTIDLFHGGRWRTRYAHLSESYVQRGDVVTRGTVIGAVGQSGLATGPHLHYEVRQAGVPQDPKRFL